MAIVFRSIKYNIKVDSNKIIGVMGNYKEFLLSLTGSNVYYIDNKVITSNKKVYELLNKEVIKDFNLRENLLNRKINELSHSEQKLLKYMLMILSNKKIIVIDEPFMDLDYSNKKKIILLFNRLIKEKKTIIIGSSDSNTIYQYCKKVLFINNNDYYYDDINVFKDSKLLKKYHISMPNLVKFVELARDKDIKLKYSQDIRELIKDVYRNVSKK